MNCTCSLDLIEKVSQESLLRVFRERLQLVDELDKIIIFNIYICNPSKACLVITVLHSSKMILFVLRWKTSSRFQESGGVFSETSEDSE